MALSLSELHSISGLSSMNENEISGISMYLALVMVERLYSAEYYYGRARPMFWKQKGVDMSSLHTEKPKVSRKYDGEICSVLAPNRNLSWTGGVCNEILNDFYRHIGLRVRSGYIEDFEKYRALFISMFGIGERVIDVLRASSEIMRASARAFCVANKIFYRRTSASEPRSLIPTISYEIDLNEVLAMLYLSLYNTITNIMKYESIISVTEFRHINKLLKYTTIFKEKCNETGGLDKFLSNEINKHLEYLGMLDERNRVAFQNAVNRQAGRIDNKNVSVAYGIQIVNRLNLPIMKESPVDIVKHTQESSKDMSPIVLASENWDSRIDFIFERIDEPIRKQKSKIDDKSIRGEAQQLQFDFNDSELPGKMQPKTYYIYTNTPFIEVEPGLKYSLVVSDVRPESHAVLSTVKMDENGMLIGAPEFTENEQLRKTVKEHFYANDGRVLLAMVNVVIKK